MFKALAPVVSLAIALVLLFNTAHDELRTMYSSVKSVLIALR